MTIAGQLYQLQEIDKELATNERNQSLIEGQIGASQEVARARARLEAEQQRLEGLERQQHEVEWEVEDLATKLSATEETLFSGKVRNPKELTNLQLEADELKARRNEMEDRELDLMSQVEASTQSINTITDEVGRLETDWRRQQDEMSAELEKLKSAHSELTRRRQEAVSGIEPANYQVYEQIKSRKGTAVARVEQGTCRGCQIALSTTEQQQVRGGGLVRCGSCGRILFLA